MKAKILPLDGKYYGTKVEIVDDDGNDFTITLWNSCGWEPSDRELGDKCTIKQWRDDVVLPYDDGWGNPTVRAKDWVDLNSGHFESRGTYRMARAIADLINGASK